jgi:hypothetical protein
VQGQLGVDADAAAGPAGRGAPAGAQQVDDRQTAAALAAGRHRQHAGVGVAGARAGPLLAVVTRQAVAAVDHLDVHGLAGDPPAHLDAAARQRLAVPHRVAHQLREHQQRVVDHGLRHVLLRQLADERAPGRAGAGAVVRQDQGGHVGVLSAGRDSGAPRCARGRRHCNQVWPVASPPAWRGPRRPTMLAR